MPMYDYQCDACQTIYPVMCRIADREIPKECPNCHSTEDSHQVILGAPSLGDANRLGVNKPSEGFRSLLKSIHERNPGSRMNEYADV